MEHSPSFLNPRIMDNESLLLLSTRFDFRLNSFMLLVDVWVTLSITRVEIKIFVWWLDGLVVSMSGLVKLTVWRLQDQNQFALVSSNHFLSHLERLEHRLLMVINSFCDNFQKDSLLPCHNINDITSKQSLITNGCVSSCYKIGCYLLVAAINSMILRNRSGPYGAVQ